MKFEIKDINMKKVLVRIFFILTVYYATSLGNTKLNCYFTEKFVNSYEVFLNNTISNLEKMEYLILNENISVKDKEIVVNLLNLFLKTNEAIDYYEVETKTEITIEKYMVMQRAMSIPAGTIQNYKKFQWMEKMNASLNEVTQKY
ncbi:MAG: hypothetical protein ACRDAQ_06610 [Cetobacterium sp.]